MRMHPLETCDVMDGIQTLAKPLQTMLDNLKAGQLETDNKAITFAALESAIEWCRIAYKSVQRAG